MKIRLISLIAVIAILGCEHIPSAEEEIVILLNNKSCYEAESHIRDNFTGSAKYYYFGILEYDCLGDKDVGKKLIELSAGHGDENALQRLAELSAF